MPSAGPGVREALQEIARQYPRSVLLDGDPLEFRLMGEDDVDAVRTFTRSMPPEDQLSLVVNFAEIGSWMETIRAGQAVTVLANRDGAVIGEGTLLHHTTDWTRHLGEIRIQITPAARRHGLARMLAAELDRMARQLDLQLLTARMTLDQSAAQSVFGRLGFHREAVLWDYAITRDGRTRNVVVATKRLARD